MRNFSEQEIVRREKVEEIRKVCNPYPERYDITHSLKEASLFFMSRVFSMLFEIISFFILNELIKMDGLIAKFIVTFFVIIINYILSKMIVFKK